MHGGVHLRHARRACTCSAVGSSSPVLHHGALPRQPTSLRVRVQAVKMLIAAQQYSKALELCVEHDVNISEVGTGAGTCGCGVGMGVAATQPNTYGVCAIICSS